MPAPTPHPDPAGHRLSELQTCLRQQLVALAPVAIAVSGGVDSLTLALLAGRTLGSGAVMVHARSPAVPEEATARVRNLAEAEGWSLRILDSGEMRDEAYLSNPHDRCFHCKQHLYQALARECPDMTLLSGTNSDDLQDYRPGLRAAERYRVRHPFVHCAVSKAGVRALCRALGRTDLAELPAAPCLASRLETGVRVQPHLLSFVHRVEQLLRSELQPQVARCRVRATEISLELDPDSLARLAGSDYQPLLQRIKRWADQTGLPLPLHPRPYRMGSAFLRPGDSRPFPAPASGLPPTAGDEAAP